MDTFIKDSKCLLEEKYAGIKTNAYYADLERLRSGEPVAYIIGYVDFLHTKIDLSFRPLIPRDETEFWLEHVINDLQQVKNEPLRFLDMFSGSGCIGIALLAHFPNGSVTFTDIAQTSLDQIKRNISINNFEERNYEILCSDVFSNLSGSYDYIFANPPYIARSKRHLTQDSVLDHEPHEALFAGDEGLHYVKELIDTGDNFLNPNGEIYIEFDPWQKSQLELYLSGSSIWNRRFFNDQYHHPRMLTLKKH